MANRVKLTPERQEVFLGQLRVNANVSDAARLISVSRAYVYDFRDRNKAFATAWDEAVSEGLDRLESEAWRRAVEGFDKPVFQMGQEVGRVREYSDQLLITLLRGRLPEKYSQKHEVSGPNGGPVQTQTRIEVVFEDPDAGGQGKVPA